MLPHTALSIGTVSFVANPRLCTLGTSKRLVANSSEAQRWGTEHGNCSKLIVTHLISYSHSQIFHLSLPSNNDFRTLGAEMKLWVFFFYSSPSPLFFLVSGLSPSNQPLIKWQVFVFIVLPSFPIQFLTAFPLSWILLSLLYSNPLPSCLYYHPSVSELGYLPFNPLIGFLPSDLFASSKCNLTLPATTHPDCSLPVPPLHLPALPTLWC